MARIVPAVLPAFASNGEMIRDGGSIPHSASTANTAMLLLRYLRRPAARKIGSSDTSGSLDSLSLALTRRQRAALGFGGLVRHAARIPPQREVATMRP